MHSSAAKLVSVISDPQFSQYSLVYIVDLGFRNIKRCAFFKDDFPVFLFPQKSDSGRAMPQAIVDPEELRHFAQNLKKFNTDVQQRIGMLNAQLIALGKSWRDQENRKFAEEFDQHMKVMARFIETAERHIPYLVRKAELIEEYMRQR